MTDQAHPVYKALAWMLAVPFALALQFYIFWSYGFAAAKLWLWFAMPRGLPQISWQEWFAVMALVALLKMRSPGRHEPADSRTTSDKAAAWISCLLVPWFTILLGWWAR
jgi:hypothetical protein